MASNNIVKKWEAELRRKQKERARRSVFGGRYRPAPPVSEGVSRRTGAPTLDAALEEAVEAAR